MPRIPFNQYDDHIDDDDDGIQNDDPRDRHGRRLPRNEWETQKQWEDQRRDRWNRQYRDDR